MWKSQHSASQQAAMSLRLTLKRLIAIVAAQIETLVKKKALFLSSSLQALQLIKPNWLSHVHVLWSGEKGN